MSMMIHPRSVAQRRASTSFVVIPKTLDLVAEYEPRADFALSRAVRKRLDELAKHHSRPTLMTGKHSGRPTIQTDIRGISVGTRIEVSRLSIRPSRQADTIAEVLSLFEQAAREEICSGPIRKIIFNYRKYAEDAVPRRAARDAFRRVFGGECCFLASRMRYLEVGRAVVHQTLLEHLLETGPYHNCNQIRVEAVRNELGKNPGRYENHRFFVEPIRCDTGPAEVRFCYSGDEPDAVVETAMRRAASEALHFVTPEAVEAPGNVFVSLSDYEGAARRYGTLWVMQDDLIQPLDRQRSGVLFLFIDDDGTPLVDRDFTWQQLYDRQCVSTHIDRSSRESPTFLDMSLEDLERQKFITRDKQTFRLVPDFAQAKHVTFYELGEYSKRLSA